MSRKRSGSGVINNVFYWIGIVMTFSCISLTLAGNTDLLWRFQHRGVPVSWVMGICAIVAFLAYEYRDSASPATYDPSESPVEAFEMELS